MLKVRHKYLSSRGPKESLVIKNGSGIGEYAPLVPIHSHSLADVEAMLMKGQWALPMEGETNLREFFQKVSYPLSYLLSQVHFTSSFLKPLDGHVELCRLLESEDVQTKSQYFKSAGFKALKIKVGRSTLEQDIARILATGDALPLRLDANQSMRIEDACALIKAIGPVEYFEEPTKNIDLWWKLKDLGVPVAIDESFGPLSEIKDFLMADVLILKPSRFHSIYEVIYLAQTALSLGLKVVLSHCFESYISASIFALLADHLKIVGPQGICDADELNFSGKIFLPRAQQMLMGFS